MKLTIISVFAAVLIVAGWGISNSMQARVTTHHVSGEMFQSNGESCVNPKIQITGTKDYLEVNPFGEFDGYVDNGSRLTFSADGCDSFTSDRITSDISNWEVELQNSSSSQNVKFNVTVKVMK